MRVRLQICHVLGAASGAASMMLWCILIFFNPYSDETSWKPALTTYIMLFLPASLAMLGVLYSYRLLLLVAFGWSILPSLYLAATPGIFAWFGAASLGYLFAYLLMKPYRPG
ncbi:hypothetical protein AK95_03505 [Paenibacillus sp. LC231]|uniref:hypothetical protein n=1 Tax=Paenibacillus sp. LC231 TaxID=1120679 RepID=UPI0008DCC39C|nr:hypothetical protein [Paenibacillus sp. LC231]OIB01982.1 hypothetical protein AK95_03505 [Paenibacillus sp. LC231]